MSSSIQPCCNHLHELAAAAATAADSAGTDRKHLPAWLEGTRIAVAAAPGTSPAVSLKDGRTTPRRHAEQLDRHLDRLQRSRQGADVCRCRCGPLPCLPKAAASITGLVVPRRGLRIDLRCRHLRHRTSGTTGSYGEQPFAGSRRRIVSAARIGADRGASKCCKRSERLLPG
jgi:hypothetical protein